MSEDQMGQRDRNDDAHRNDAPARNDDVEAHQMGQIERHDP